MKGSIIGDIIGSPYEAIGCNTKDFPLFSPESKFTDDTICTIAVAESIMEKKNLGEKIIQWGNLYPDSDYGPFIRTLIQNKKIFDNDSKGNGAVMRISSCYWLAKSKKQALKFAQKSCYPTHIHPESFQSVQAIIDAMYLTDENTRSKDLQDICQKYFNQKFLTVEEYHSQDDGSPLAGETTIRALSAVSEASSYEEAIRNAIFVNRDTDTSAAVAGTIAEIYFGIPNQIWQKTQEKLPENILSVIEKVYQKSNEKSFLQKLNIFS